LKFDLYKSDLENLLIGLAYEANNWSEYVKLIKEKTNVDIKLMAVHENEYYCCERIWRKYGKIESPYLLPHPLGWYVNMERYINAPMMRIVCENCGKSKHVIISRAKNSRHYFCSKACATIFKNRTQRKNNTDIEQIMESWLLESGIIFSEQYIIMLKGMMTIVDFFIPPNICLYVDGDYWHSFMDCILKDRKQTDFLMATGFKVIRLRGSDILLGKRPMELLDL